MKKIGFFIVVAFLALACEKQLLITEDQSEMGSPSLQMETKTDVPPAGDVPTVTVPEIKTVEIITEEIGQ